uniref:Uncharacterized protein n=1 Tax=Graphocephala atropunctata TaxID=36148 RepID=A0A1B6MCN7_9HEMI
MDDFSKTLAKGITFGQVKDSDFQTLESEQLEQERKRREELKKADALRREVEEDKKKQEYEDYLLALEEQKKCEFEFNHNSRLKQDRPFAGRGSILMSQEGELTDQVPAMRGRGRYYKSPHQRAANKPIWKKDQDVRDMISECGGGDYIRNYSKLPGEQLSPLFFAGPTESSEQFEDAWNNSSSAQHSPHSILSVLSSPSVSPAEPLPAQAIFPPLDRPTPALHKEDFPSLPSPSLRGPRKSRIAANFSKKFVEEETPAEEDTLAVLSSSARPLGPTRLSAPRAVSINDLHSSQRIIGHNLLRPEDIQNTSYSQGFNLNPNDFPSL